jgi:osmotically-inducible protein OsmY
MKATSILAALLFAAGAAAQVPAPPAIDRAGADVASERHPDSGDPVENVKRALRETDLPADAIVISKHAQALVLTGTVASKADAARAASTAQAAAGDVRVINELQVQPPGKPASSATDRAPEKAPTGATQDAEAQ